MELGVGRQRLGREKTNKKKYEGKETGLKKPDHLSRGKERVQKLAVPGQSIMYTV